MRELLSFLALVRDDPRMGPVHVSLFVALLSIRPEGVRYEAFGVSRSELMELSRIRDRGSFYSCMRDLVECGYIIYKMEHYPGKRSQVSILQRSCGCSPVGENP